MVEAISAKLYTEKATGALGRGVLIPIDNNLGLHLIDVGEVLRRLGGKVVMYVAKKDVQHAAGALQVCAGQSARAEASIHGMHNLFQEDKIVAFLLIDAENAFNSINRE